MVLAPLIAALLYIFDTVIELYIVVIIVAVVVSWLFALDVLNYHNQLARTLAQVLRALTEPVFRPVRRIVPPIGGLDLSPLIVLIALRVLQLLVDSYVGMAIAQLYR